MWAEEDRAILDMADEIAKDFEGLSLEPYHDPVGYPTIGYGHLLSRQKWADLGRWPPLRDEAHAIQVLWKDMERALDAAYRLVDVELETEQWAAVVDFCFNCGSGNFQISSLRRVINAREFRAAPMQFKRWVYGGGKILPGLVRRRRYEAELWASVVG